MKNQDFDLDDFTEINELDYGGVTEGEVNEKINYVEENLWSKLDKIKRTISFARDVLALYKYMRDPAVAWYKKSVVIAGLIYFITPIDAIPDFTPVVGFLDDLGIIAALTKYLGRELVPYY
ncbi:MAG: YkvA family protein [Ignavibacteriaceae bacterium]